MSDFRICNQQTARVMLGNVLMAGTALTHKHAEFAANLTVENSLCYKVVNRNGAAERWTT
jgi:hypothetical protein